MSESTTIDELRARAEAAERERDEARAAIKTQNGVVLSAINARIGCEDRADALAAERDRLRADLAAYGLAATGMKAGRASRRQRQQMQSTAALIAERDAAVTRAEAAERAIRGQTFTVGPDEEWKARADALAAENKRLREALQMARGAMRGTAEVLNSKVLHDAADDITRVLQKSPRRPAREGAP
jgi:hypothetical protein